jgi:hypothetical protein
MNKPHLTLARIIAWAAEAAREHVELARFNGEEPDLEGGMGLWQSFQATFPKTMFPGDYDLAITVYSATFTETVKALVAFQPDGGRKEWDEKHQTDPLVEMHDAGH